MFGSFRIFCFNIFGQYDIHLFYNDILYHEIKAVLCMFLPPQFVWKEEVKFRFEVKLVNLRKAALQGKEKLLLYLLRGKLTRKWILSGLQTHWNFTVHKVHGMMSQFHFALLHEASWRRAK